jgi:hypothetical protein
MNRLRLSLGVLVALALAGLSARELVAPRPAWAICFCASQTHQGPSAWGSGASCTAAHNSLINNAWSAFDCNGYNSCSETLVVTASCYWDASSGMYKEDGYYRYRCQTGDTCP